MEELEEEGFLPWFLYAKKLDIEVPPATRTVPLPDDFLREVLAGSDELNSNHAWVYNANTDYWQPLDQEEGDPIIQGRRTASAAWPDALPNLYYVDIMQDFIMVDTEYSSAYTIGFEYVRKGDRYTATPQPTEEPLWAKHAPGYLIAMCGLRIANMYIKNKEAGQMFIADVQRERTKLIHKHTTILESRIAVNSEN
jgi:hypothetical protein